MDAGPVSQGAPAGIVRFPSRMRLTRVPDAHLVVLIRQRRQGAFEAVYDRHRRAIVSFCRSILGDRHEAEGAVLCQCSGCREFRRSAAARRAVPSPRPPN